MAKIVSRFRQHRRTRLHPLSLLIHAGRNSKRFLSLNVFSIKRKRSKARRISPQAYLQRDVHSRRFENPYQHQPRFVRLRELFSANRFRLSVIVLAGLAGTWAYTLFFSPAFYVQAVTVTGTQEIPKEDIARLIDEHLDERAWLLFPRNHLFFLRTKNIDERIRSKYHLSSLTFTKIWSSQRLQLVLEEKQSVFAYSVDTKFFSLDREGIVIRELPSQPETTGTIPIIYQYDSSQIPHVGQAVLNSEAIAAIERIYTGLQSYPGIQVHSFRVRISPQREITIVEKTPEDENPAEEKKKNTTSPQLALAAESIAKAQTVEDRVNSLKKALQEISLEKLEESTIDTLFRDERVYAPDPNYQYQELEVYMAQGWSLKAGHAILEDAKEAERILNIFATLNQQLNVSREVREYIDLRFGNRVYYR